MSLNQVAADIPTTIQGLENEIKYLETLTEDLTTKNMLLGKQLKEVKILRIQDSSQQAQINKLYTDESNQINIQTKVYTSLKEEAENQSYINKALMKLHEKQIQELQIQIQINEADIASYENQIEEKETKIDQLQQRDFDLQKMNSLKLKQEFNDRYKEFQDRCMKIEARISSQNQKISSSNKMISDLDYRITQLEDDKIINLQQIILRDMALLLSRRIGTLNNILDPKNFQIIQKTQLHLINEVTWRQIAKLMGRESQFEVIKNQIIRDVEQLKQNRNQLAHIKNVELKVLIKKQKLTEMDRSQFQQILNEQQQDIVPELDIQFLFELLKKLSWDKEKIMNETNDEQFFGSMVREIKNQE